MHYLTTENRLRQTLTASALGLSAVSLSTDALGEAPAPLELEPIEVTATRDDGLRSEYSASVKYVAPLLDTPQTITVIPAPLIARQQALGLRQVLANVSGITFNAGEGGGGSGDSLNIRGFSADNNLQVDGLRDSAQFTRSDTFNVERVEVIKGPNSVFGGAGTTGGSVNIISKVPEHHRFNQLSASLGSAQYQRLTLDSNQPVDGVGQGSALRINLMAHQNDVPGRPGIERQRWGVAPSLLLGLSDSTRLTLSALHQVDDNLPDYGVPAREGKRLAGVGRHSYFGWKNLDKEQVEQSVLTFKVDHDINDNLRLQQLARYSQVRRDTVVSASHVNTEGLPVGHYLPAGPQGYGRDATTELWISQTSLLGHGDWLGLGHDWNAGVELSRETLDLKTYNHGLGNALYPAGGYALANPPGTWSGPAHKTPLGYNESELTDQALYLFDTIALAEHWDLHLGLRYDHYVGKARGYKPGQERTAFTSRDDALSGRAGLVYKPSENGRVYLSWGTSFNPSAEALVSNGRGLTAATQGLEPEQSQTWELGSKWIWLDQQLELDTALFHIIKSNAREALADGSTQLSGKQRVQGFELGLTGHLSSRWSVFANYTFLDSETLEAAPGGTSFARKGQALGNTPPRSLSLWTTYNLSDDWTLGYGARHVSKRNVTSSGTAKLDGYWVHNAMLGYQVNPQLDLQLNINNLFDKTYVERVRQQRGNAARSSAIEYGDARGALLTANYRF
ncbi:TonB-dependent siderophore receptor [Pseudomonas sp. Teo4]|uniref:TonB-dependent receptor n=1 Tax=Pseudomonas sp. Teo4 TaxID=3064528 RepID=UPI002ABC618A|nr:TonB-dependent siderophore receptor [Pseudomonas sp. Teo4]MDZ3992370.1 putative TonB-dependent receptor BfrD [Pseudomonas sp. Teo4]